MNNAELGRQLDEGVERRVHGKPLRPDVDDLFARIERRTTRRTRWGALLLVGMLALGGLAGYALGQDSDTSQAPTVAVLSDGLPDPSAAAPALVPTDVEAARAAVEDAFRQAYTGSLPFAAHTSAIQDGPALEPLRRSVLASAAAHGYTSEQLAGTTVEVHAVEFIDEDHAAVRFTISVPGRGPVLADRTGYAVRIEGDWKVALRTACDILSLGGSVRTCPPQ